MKTLPLNSCANPTLSNKMMKKRISWKRALKIHLLSFKNKQKRRGARTPRGHIVLNFRYR